MQLSDAGRDLRTALDDFRRQQMVEKHGSSLLDALGASIIMPNAILERLVECAEAKKIESAVDLQREVGKKWTKARELGGAVVEIILRYVLYATWLASTSFTMTSLQPFSSQHTLQYDTSHPSPTAIL